ncbi:MAG: hypothetical protein HXY19_02365 [Thermoanaerobaculaceae bacterium]|nr:hypothetical protein [Thermoanaerobaculaceae bacterium]
MRAILGLVVLLVAVAVVLTLSARDTKKSFEAVQSVSTTLRDDTAPLPFEEEAARALARRLDELSGVAELPRQELAEAAATCAGWAAATTPGTAPYRAAVKLRAAADALLAAGPGAGDPERRRARRLVQEAMEALGSPGGSAGGSVGAIRDQLENLATRHQEELQQGSEALP